MRPSRLLISFLGRPRQPEGYDEVDYLTNGALVVRSRHCMEAFAQRLAMTEGDAALLLHTKNSAQWVRPSLDALTRFGVEMHSLQLPVVTSSTWRDAIGQLENCLHDLSQRRQLEVTLDLTHGFRADSFLVLHAIDYLATRLPIRLASACYARMVTDDRYELDELSSLFAVRDLDRAATTMVKYGHVGPMIEALKSATQDRGDWRLPRELTGRVVNQLKRLDEALTAVAAPAVQDALRALQDELSTVARQPTARLAAGSLQHALRDLLEGCGTVPPSSSEPSMTVLRNLARWYRDRGRTPAAALVVSEALTTRMVVALGRTQEWTRYEVRKEAGMFLTGLKQRSAEARGTSIEKLDTFVQRLGSCRNPFAHCFTCEAPSPDTALANARELIGASEHLLVDDALWQEAAAKFREWRPDTADS